MKEKHIKISDEVMAVLKKAEIGETYLRLGKDRLAGPLYSAVNKVLEAAGGKWDRRTQTHQFPNDPRAVLGLAITNGKILNHKQTFQYFPTPVDVVSAMLLAAGIRDGERVLEPSAGEGAIIEGICATTSGGTVVVAIELDKERAAKVGRLFPFVAILCGDFMEFAPSLVRKVVGKRLGHFDRILMNPPFTGGQDIRHILHARKFLAPRGRLVAICAGGERQKALLKPLALTWDELPAGSFSDAGTEARTVLLSMEA